MLLVSLLLLSACGTPAPPVAADRPLRIGFGIGRTARADGLQALVDLLYAEPLFRREWSGRTTPHLVDDWGWGQDGRTLRLRLKKNVLFHDGTPLTAEILAGQLQGLMPDAEGKAAWGFVHVTRVAHQGTHEVVIELSEPDAFLLSALSDFKIVHPSLPDVATGPFKMVSRDDTVRTERFDAYHAGRSPFSGAIIQTYDTQRSAWAALMRDEVDVVQEVNRDSVEFMQGQSGVSTFSSLQPFFISLVLNHRHPALRRVEIRRALTLGIDREEIVRIGMRGRGRAASGQIWPFHWASSEREETGNPYDPNAARALLDAAGLSGRAAHHDRPPSRLRLHCLVYSEDPQYERIALLLQRQLFQIGVDLDIQLATMKEIGSAMTEGTFETLLIPANASRTLERVYRWWHSGGPEGPAQFNTGYTGADDALRRLRASTNDDEFRRNVAALTRVFDEDVPAVFIAWLEVTRAVSASVSVGEGDGRDPFVRLWQWRPAR